MDKQSQQELLRAALVLACQAQNAGLITRGRQQALELPREWVVSNVERIEAEALNLSDEWEYRRLLELFELLDTQLVQNLVAAGLTSADADVREAAVDFQR